MDIEQRVSELERAVRQWRAMAMVSMLIGVGAMLLGAAAPPGPLRATSLDIVDSSGRARVRLNVEHDTPQIALWGETNDIRAQMSVSHGETPGIFLSTHEDTGVMLAATREESCGMFTGAASSEVLMIGSDQDGADLTIVDHQGKFHRFPD